MSARLSLASLAALALSLPSAAQTFVVDDDGGPGVDFTDLPDAVAAVPDGATLLVRAGSYHGFATGKALTVLGAAASLVDTPISITGIPRSKSFVLSGLTWANELAGSPRTRVVVRSCPGFVLLQDLHMPSTHPHSEWRNGLEAFDCQHLVTRDCTWNGGVSLTQCVAAMETCVAHGHDGYWNYPTTSISGRPGLTLSATDLQVAGASRIDGGDGTWGSRTFAAAAPAVRMSLSQLRVLSGSLVGGGLFPGASWYPCVEGDGEVRVDPRVTLLYGWTPFEGVSASTASMPALGSTGGPLGTSSTVTVDAENGNLVLIALGLPGPPTTVAPFLDRFWLDPVAHGFYHLATQQPGRPVTASIAIPAWPQLLGVKGMWQAAVEGPGTGLQATNPSAILVR